MKKVKEILAKVGYYKRLQASSKAYVKKREFEKWLAQRDLPSIAKVISRLAVLAETKVYLLWINPSSPAST